MFSFSVWINSIKSYLTHWFVNTLWPCDTIWWQRSGSALAKLMAFCLMAPSHYLSQCWLPIQSLLRFCGIHPRAISQWVPKLLYCIWKIILLKLLPPLPGASELTYWEQLGISFWIINLLILLGHETMVCAVCLTVFLLKKYVWISFRKFYADLHTHPWPKRGPRGPIY